MPRTLIVIGIHVASRFASQGFSKIALLARNKEQLARDSAAVKTRRADLHVKTYAVDVTDSAELSGALGAITDDLGPPEVVFFNAARVKPSTLLEVDDEELLYDCKVCSLMMLCDACWRLSTRAVPVCMYLCDADRSESTC